MINLFLKRCHMDLLIFILILTMTNFYLKEYRNKFKFDGTPENLSKKITDFEDLKLDEINKIINFSQSKLEKQSVKSLVERVLTII